MDEAARVVNRLETFLPEHPLPRFDCMSASGALWRSSQSSNRTSATVAAASHPSTKRLGRDAAPLWTGNGGWWRSWKFLAPGSYCCAEGRNYLATCRCRNVILLKKGILIKYRMQNQRFSGGDHKPRRRENLEYLCCMGTTVKKNFAVRSHFELTGLWQLSACLRKRTILLLQYLRYRRTSSAFEYILEGK